MISTGIIELIKASLNGNHEFWEDSGCRCIGSNVMVQCKVVGNSGGITWTGSALDCSYSGKLPFCFLTVFKVVYSGSKTCNNGEIVGQSLPVEDNNVYPSQLNVILSSHLIDRMIKCVYVVHTHREIIGVVNQTSITGNINFYA